MSKPGAAIRAAGWVTVGIVAAGGVATAATSGSSGSSSNVTPAASSPSTGAATGHARAGKAGRAGKLAKLRGRLLHGQFTVQGKDNKPVTRAEQRGTVQLGVGSTTITLKSTDGYSQTYVVTPNTKVRINGKKASISDVKEGQTAGVIAKVDGAKLTATAIVERAAH